MTDRSVLVLGAISDIGPADDDHPFAGIRLHASAILSGFSFSAPRPRFYRLSIRCP